MKRFSKFLLATLFAGMIGASLSFSKQVYTKVDADSITPISRNGESGTLLFVNGSGTYFNSGVADLVICCWRGAESAWSQRSNYRVEGDTIRIMIPYKRDGGATTWSHFKICRYNPTLDPVISEQNGVYNETDALSFADTFSAYGVQNVITINGYGEGNKITCADLKGYINYYGVKAERHMYLDLSSFTEWEKDNAKFAIYFGCPGKTNESRWSQANEVGNAYYSSFCWKVNGQDNNHLYECIVPNIYQGDARNIWNLVIAVRFNQYATSPDWDKPYDWGTDWIYNKTQDLKFVSTNGDANMIRISGWNDGYLDATNSIADSTRLEFYGKYFMDTVACSGSGASDSTTGDMWNAVKREYQVHLSRYTQGDVWTTIANKDIEATKVAQAMARYDYILFCKKYDHEDFINRGGSEYQTQYASSPISVLNNAENNSTSLMIAIVASVSLISVSILIVVKKSRIRGKNL